MQLSSSMIIVATMISFLTANRAQSAFIPKKLATGAFHTCALSTTGTVKCWGSNEVFQLGTGDSTTHGSAPGTMGRDLPYVNLGTNQKAVDICASNWKTCVATDQGQVKCWGHNYNGQLGQGSLVDSGDTIGDAMPFTPLGRDFHAVRVSCGGDSACALDDKGRAKCWGNNELGELGLGDTKLRGTSNEQMGENLPYVQTSKPIRMLSTGMRHTCAVTDDGLFCWGDGSPGVLGQETTNNLSTSFDTIPSKIAPIHISGEISNPNILGLSGGFTHICVWYQRASAVLEQTPMKCWGANTSGSLGTGDTLSYGGAKNSMGAFLPLVALGINDLAQVESHHDFSCALTKLGRVKCWGEASQGSLGLGDMTSRGTAKNEMGDQLPYVDLGLPAKTLSVGANSQHSCAILINNNVKCWGLGNRGQLGYESDANIGNHPDQMGDALPYVRIE